MTVPAHLTRSRWAVLSLALAGSAAAGIASHPLIGTSFASQSPKALATFSQTSLSPLAASPSPRKVRLTVLNDAFGKDPSLQQDWGYAALVEYGGKRILFDTGNNGDVLAKNAKAKGVNLATVDTVVISHRHGDHIGGLALLQKLNPNVKIYAPKEGFGVFGANLPSTFYRKDASLPAEQRYFNGSPTEILRFGTAWPGAKITLVDKNTEIAPGIHLLSLVSDKPGTLELRELSLVIDTPSGAVVIVGCSHPGVEKIVETATSINPRIALVAGGFHLIVAKDEEINRVANSLKDTYKVAYIAPGHCTGEPTFNALQKTFGNSYLYAGVGTTLDQGALSSSPTASSASSKQPVAMDQKDLESYRKLLARSDDNEHGATAHSGHSHQ